MLMLSTIETLVRWRASPSHPLRSQRTLYLCRTWEAEIGKSTELCVSRCYLPIVEAVRSAADAPPRNFKQAAIVDGLKRIRPNRLLVRRQVSTCRLQRRPEFRTYVECPDYPGLRDQFNSSGSAFKKPELRAWPSAPA